MAAPCQERLKVLIPLPPLPEFYLVEAESGNMVLPSASPTSHVKHTAKSNKKAKSKAKGEVLPPAKPLLPPAKPASIEAAPRAKPTKADGRSLPLVNPPTFPPPGVELDEHGNMANRYSHHHLHARKPITITSKPTKHPLPPAARIINIPPPPPGFPVFQPDDPPAAQCTLTIYHVCRICMRPRSEKYHLEHPTPVDGVLPPPGICRRCRIKSVDHKDDHTEVIQIEESEKVKIGISAFLPKTKDRLYTREEASKAIKKQRERGYAERFIRESSSDEEDPDPVVYRYVKRTKKPAPESSTTERAEVSVENLAAMNLMNDQFSPRPETKMPAVVKVKERIVVQDEPEGIYVAEEIRITEVDKVDGSGPSAPSRSSRSSETPTTTATAKAPSTRAPSTKASVSVKTSVSGSQSSVKATAQVTTPDAQGFTESEIRIFARDEVERYRQAERMVHAHPNAFAHGRLVPVEPPVPVERRIEMVSDKAALKPWEVPSSPPKEPVFETRRSRNTSTATREGSGYMERAPSEDSRHWYRVADNPASGTRSTSSKSSTTIGKDPASSKGSRHGERKQYEYDLDVVVERGRRPQPSQRLPEIDPPISVKLKEVVGIIREEPIRSKQPSVSSGRHHDLDIIEVTEEIELPADSGSKPASTRTTDPVTSQRVRILRGEPASQRQEQSKHGSSKTRDPESTRDTSFRTDKSYWEDEGAVRTASGHSSMRPEVGTETQANSWERRSYAEQDTAVEQTDIVAAMPSPRHFHPRLSSHGRSDDDSWYASHVQKVKRHQQTPEKFSYDSGQQKEDDDKTVWPADEEPVRPAASERMSLRDDWDWEYRKRVVTSIDRPPGSRHDDHAVGKGYTDTERLFRRRLPSQPAAQPADTEDQSPPQGSHVQQRLPSAAPSSPKFSIRSRIEQKPAQDRGRGPYMHTAEESAHVRFASKVEFSPTPPNSDESLPERVFQMKPSSQHSSKGPLKKSALRNQIDGGASEPPESAEDLISAYESNRSLRGRSVEGREDLEYVSARCASSAKGSAMSGQRAAESARSEPRSFRSQTSRHTTYTHEDEVFVEDPPRDVGHDDDRRSGRSSRRSDTARRSSPGDTETATQLDGSRRLTRALSESPSRERMHQDFVRAQKQQNHGSRASHDWLDPKEDDGKGPYREESRTESMNALYGSGHGGPKEKRREYVVREKW